MSSPSAIAAITGAIRNLLQVAVEDELAGTSVTTRPLDKAVEEDPINQVNLFLYLTEPNAAWRNRDFGVKNGEPGHPPLALDLRYLVTAYAALNDDSVSHRLLGRAMSTLHDHTLLSNEELEAALGGTRIADQVERVRISHDPLTVEEMSKLWNAFNTEYRLSAAYNASVVLIESRLPSRSPLPVLERVPSAASGIVPPFPTLESVLPPDAQAGVRLGELLTLRGHDLEGDVVEVRVRSTRWDEPVPLPPEAGASARQLAVLIPDEPEDWPPGTYTVSVGVSSAGEPERSTNTLAFILAPAIDEVLPLQVVRDPNGDVDLSIASKPFTWPEQTAALLVAGRQVPAAPRVAKNDPLEFEIASIAPGPYWIRLRVDGADSILVDRSATPPSFDATQRLEVA